MGTDVANPAVHVAMLGARMHYAVPRLLHEAGLLGRFYTDSYAGNKPALAAALGKAPGLGRRNAVRRWLGRADATLPPEKVVSFEALGLRYAWAQRRAGNDPGIQSVYDAFARAFDRRVIRHLEQTGATPQVVWGFNGASLELFEWARARGIRCVLEQTSAPRAVRRELLAREVERWPGWQPGLSVPAGQDALAAREQREWALADCIVGGSAFVTDALVARGVPAEKCQVVPYGVDVARFGAAPRAPGRERTGPLRVLFVGEVGLLKGSPYLLEALRRLGPERVHARFVGHVALEAKRLQRYRDVADFRGVVPRTAMAAELAWADVFCLPAICEGSATVIYEALMAGLAVVTTPNAGSIVTDGESGRIVRVGDVDGLSAALQAYIDDPALLEAHCAGARALRDYAGLDRYRADLTAVVGPLTRRHDAGGVPAGAQGDLRTGG